MKKKAASINKPKKPKPPAWALDPFKRFLERSETLLRLMQLSARGISLLRSVPKAVEALALVERELALVDGKEGVSSHTTRLEEARIEADLAQKEVDQGFPLLHNQAILLTWAYLEGAVKSFVCAYIKNSPQIFKIPEFKKLKVELGEYESVLPENRADYIYDLYEREVARGELYGISRSDKILSPLGISGPITSEIRQDIFTLAQIRNAIIHRGGIVDHKFIQQCPYLDLELGKDIEVSHVDFDKYMKSVHLFITLLICRVGIHYGVDMSSISKGILAGRRRQKKSKNKKPEKVDMREM